MAESSIKPQKYIPNPFEAYALKELKQLWRFYDSKEEFEKLVSIIKMAGELEEDYIPPFEKLVTDKYL